MMSYLDRVEAGMRMRIRSGAGGRTGSASRWSQRVARFKMRDYDWAGVDLG